MNVLGRVACTTTNERSGTFIPREMRSWN